MPSDFQKQVTANKAARSVSLGKEGEGADGRLPAWPSPREHLYPWQPDVGSTQTQVKS